MAKYKKFNCLPVLLMILIACRSQGNRVREEKTRIARVVFVLTDSPWLNQLKPENPLNPNRGRMVRNFGRYNAYRIHAKDPSRCLLKEQCVRKWTEWGRYCVENRIRILESIILLGFSSGRSGCDLNQPVC